LGFRRAHRIAVGVFQRERRRSGWFKAPVTSMVPKRR
jgi:hypothetical protein